MLPAPATKGAKVRANGTKRVAVSGQAGKFDLRIVDDQFDGKRTITRQQAVYAPLNSYIASGEVHAVTIRAMTKDEWRKASLFGA